MNDSRSVRVLLFPSGDAALRADVERSLQRVRGRGSDSEQAEALQADLQPWYRSVVVHVREAFAGYEGEDVPTWYVYRDGRVRARSEPLDRLYQALSMARETCRTSVAALESARAVASLAGYPAAPRRDAEPVIGPVAAVPAEPV